MNLIETGPQGPGLQEDSPARSGVRLAELRDYLPQITTIIFVVDIVIILVCIPWILIIKRDSTAAIAWSLIVILLPIIGSVLFVLFGYTRVHRPLRKKRRHRAKFKARRPDSPREPGENEPQPDPTWQDLGNLAVRLGGFPVCDGNRIALYHDTQAKFNALYEAVRAARHHIHLEYFIIRADPTGRELFELLIEKAKAKVEVRVLYDALGSRRLARRMIRALKQAGGLTHAFLPFSLLRRRIQINLRNHRKIAVIDGRVAFTGGVNIGDEYLGKVKAYGYWRDSHVRIEGPAVADLQRIFIEDWDFATKEFVDGEAYYPELPPAGTTRAQIVASGPDQEFNAFRDLLFAALTSARGKIWIETPYFVPDSGIVDAVRLAARRGVDVRILVPQKPDHWLTHFASGYYFAELIPEGVKVYLYKKGMMHAKVTVIDGEWGFVGSSNIDNRSLKLNFEVNCVIHSRDELAELEREFLRDQAESILLQKKSYGARGFFRRLAENACRLLSPML